MLPESATTRTAVDAPNAGAAWDRFDRAHTQTPPVGCGAVRAEDRPGWTGVCMGGTDGAGDGFGGWSRFARRSSRAGLYRFRDLHPRHRLGTRALGIAGLSGAVRA